MKDLKDKSHQSGPDETKRIVYSCKKCKWTTSILVAWGDLRPKRCGNRRCRWFFLKYPQDLLVERPVKKEKPKQLVQDDKKKVQILKKQETENLTVIKNDKQIRKFK